MFGESLPSRLSPFARFDTLRQVQRTALNGLVPEPVEGPGDEGRGDIGVRFDKLNELRDRKIPKLSVPQACPGLDLGVRVLD